MSFKKPFRAIPVRLGPYHRALERRKHVSIVAKVIVLAIVGGLIAGSLMGLYQQGYLSKWATSVHDGAASRGIIRKRPQPGDHWSGCNDARAAGVAPLYEGEPGYRPEMDGDSDGIACEPYRGY